MLEHSFFPPSMKVYFTDIFLSTNQEKFMILVETFDCSVVISDFRLPYVSLLLQIDFDIGSVSIKMATTTYYQNFIRI